MSLASGVEAEAERDSSKRDFVNRCELNSSIVGLVFCGNGCEMNQSRTAIRVCTLMMQVSRELSVLASSNTLSESRSCPCRRLHAIHV